MLADAEAVHTAANEQGTLAVACSAPRVIEGRIQPGRVFDRTIRLEGVPDGYRAMNEREILKVMVQP